MEKYCAVSLEPRKGVDMKLGKYETREWVRYLKDNPQLMDRILTFYNRFDLPGLLEFFQKMDLSAPLPPQPLRHKNYIENQAEIDRLVREPNAYPEKVEDRGYLQDDYIKELYSKSVETYDLIWGGEWVYEARKETADLLQAKPGDRILEVGVGTGTNLAYYPAESQITGIDYCQAMLHKATERAKQLPGNRIAVELMDVLDMAFPENSFDKVLSFYFLSSCRDPGQALQEIKRVCRPGGRLVIFDAIKSDIDEVAVVQYLFRPVARVLGPIYLEFCPPRLLPWNSFLDLFALLKKLGFGVEKAKATDLYKTINIIRCTNKK